MAIASNQTELQSALNSMASLIEITNDFTISSLVTISYSVVIRSTEPGATRTISRAPGHDGALFSISVGTAELTYIALSGSAAPDSPPLIYVAGTLSATRCAFENSLSRQSGVAIATTSGGATMSLSETSITGCRTAGSGGSSNLQSGSRLEARGSTFSHNSASINGGAILA